MTTKEIFKNQAQRKELNLWFKFNEKTFFRKYSVYDFFTDLRKFGINPIEFKRITPDDEEFNNKSYQCITDDGRKLLITLKPEYSKGVIHINTKMFIDNGNEVWCFMWTSGQLKLVLLEKIFKSTDNILSIHTDRNSYFAATLEFDDNRTIEIFFGKAKLEKKYDIELVKNYLLSLKSSVDILEIYRELIKIFNLTRQDRRKFNSIYIYYDDPIKSDDSEEEIWYDEIAIVKGKLSTLTKTYEDCSLKIYQDCSWEYESTSLCISYDVQTLISGDKIVLEEVQNKIKNIKTKVKSIKKDIEA